MSYRHGRHRYVSNPALTDHRHYPDQDVEFTDAPAPKIADLEHLGIEPGGLAVVLGSGGATGMAYHAGVLWALEEITGLDMRTHPEVIIGTSAGAIIGAFLRDGHTPRELALADPAELSSPDPHRRRLLIPGWTDPATLVRRMIGAGYHLAHFVNPLLRNRAPSEFWMTHFPGGLYEITEADWEHQRMPAAWPERALWVVTGDLDRRERVVLRRPLLAHETADLRTAVQASMSLPGVWPPVHVGGRRLYDGGLASSQINLDLALRARAGVAVAVCPMGYDETTPIPRRLNFGRRATNRQLNAEAAAVRAAGADVLTVAPTASEVALVGFNFLDRSKTRAVAGAAFTAAIERFGRPDAQPVIERLRQLAGPPRAPRGASGKRQGAAASSRGRARSAAGR